MSSVGGEKKKKMLSKALLLLIFVPETNKTIIGLNGLKP